MVHFLQTLLHLLSEITISNVNPYILLASRDQKISEVSQYVPKDDRKVPIKSLGPPMWRKEHQEQWGHSGSSAATQN